MRAPSVARLRELLDYNQITGVFTWKVSTSNRVRVGDVAGHLRHDGYHCISIDGVVYLAHLLAWLHFYGEWPKKKIDHADTIRNHNWISNLREVTNSQNGINGATFSHNTSGYRGVSFQKLVGRWQAYIVVNKRQIHLGYHETRQEAAAARKRAEKEYFGEFAPGPDAKSVSRTVGPTLVDLGRAARAAGLTLADIEEIGRLRTRRTAA